MRSTTDKIICCKIKENLRKNGRKSQVENGAICRLTLEKRSRREREVKKKKVLSHGGPVVDVGPNKQSLSPLWWPLSQPTSLLRVVFPRQVLPISRPAYVNGSFVLRILSHRVPCEGNDEKKKKKEQKARERERES